MGEEKERERIRREQDRIEQEKARLLQRERELHGLTEWIYDNLGFPSSSLEEMRTKRSRNYLNQDGEFVTPRHFLEPCSEAEREAIRRLFGSTGAPVTILQAYRNVNTELRGRYDGAKAKMQGASKPFTRHDARTATAMQRNAQDY